MPRNTDDDLDLTDPRLDARPAMPPRGTAPQLRTIRTACLLFAAAVALAGALTVAAHAEEVGHLGAFIAGLAGLVVAGMLCAVAVVITVIIMSHEYFAPEIRKIRATEKDQLGILRNAAGDELSQWRH